MPSLGDENVITFFFFQFAADILSQITSNLALKEFDQKRSPDPGGYQSMF